MKKETKVLIIFGGSLVKDKNRWRTTNFDEGDNFGGLGDRLRVVATHYFYKKNPDTTIIAIGGSGQLKKIRNAPAVSEVIKNELVGLGVSKEKIIIETKSGNTLEGLISVQEIVSMAGYKRIALISNEYHLPRVQAMIEYSDKLSKLLDLYSVGEFELLSAEKICIDSDKSRWQSVIQKAYESELMQKRIRNEKKGIEDIKTGMYRI